MPARYVVHNGAAEFLVTVTEEGDGYRIDIDGEAVHVDARSTPGSPTRSLIIDGRSYEAATMATRDGTDVYVSGDVFHVRVTNELWARAESAAHAGGDGEEIVSPMPGSVVKVLVAVGDVVDPGATVAVVEAMKMQNDLAAVRGGTVREIRVKSGDVVDQGTVLVVLGAADGGPPGEEA
jgi:biotin carboxyl carrier protein